MDYCDEEELVEVVEPAEEQLDDLHMSKCSKKMRLEPVSELSRESKQISSQSSRIDSLCDFAHTLMHCVLYKINYYNKKTHFDKVLKYNIIVYKCKSEVVCEYIANCIESMRLVLYKVHSPGRHSLNRSIFSIGLAVLKAMSDDQPTNDVNLLIKRYTLQIEMKLDGNDEQQSQMDEWNYRDSILKCLYANDIVYPKNFKWQIQMRTSLKAVNELSNDEDLFKLFAWRQCDREEISSISTKPKASYNRISIKPVKTLSHCSMRAQLFIEQPTAPLKSPIHKTARSKSTQMTWQIPWPEFLKKRLCRYLLQHYLGHFFKEKISLEQLSIDIYNGTGCVKDLHLDCDALNEQLDSSLASASPIQIVSGFVGYISVCIPWHDLFNDSCKLVVKNVQVTIRSKGRPEHSFAMPHQEPHLGDSMANSMFSSVIIDSLMNTSMHIAQECLAEQKLDESKAPLLGLEAFASTIDSILSRIQISLEQIQIRIEHVEKQKVDLTKSSAALFSQELSSSGIALELRIKSIQYFDVESASGQDSLHSRNTTKNFCIQGLTVYFDEFMVRDDASESRSDSSLNSSVAANDEAPVDECPPFNFDLDPNYYLYTSPVIMVTFGGIQSIRLTINNMRPSDLMLDATSPGNQVAGQQRPFLEVSAQFGAIKCLLCPKQIHLLTDMVSKLVDYMDTVERMKREFKLNMMKKKTGIKKPVRGETSCETTTKTTSDYSTLISSTDSDNFKSIYEASDGTSESAMFYSMMADAKTVPSNPNDLHPQSFGQQLKENIEQLQNDPIKLTSNHNLFQTFKVTLRQLSVTVLHRDPPPAHKASRLIVQRIKHVSDFYFDWSSTIETQSDIRPECTKYHQASAFNDHFLLLLKPITMCLTQKINERTKAQHYSLNDLAVSVGYAQLNEYLNSKPVAPTNTLRSSAALELSRTAQITELVHFSVMPMEQACLKAQVTVYEPSEPHRSHDLLARSFDNIVLTVHQSLAIELDISIVDRLFYILNDTSKMRSAQRTDVTAKSDLGLRTRNVEVKCEQCVKVAVRFPIADLSRLYQTNIVHSDSTRASFKMKTMGEFRNLREQLLTLHLFGIGFETLQNRKAAESDLVMRVSAGQVNAYYQFSREERPIHFGLVHGIAAQIKVPFRVQQPSERLDGSGERDTMQYERDINVSRAMNENESDDEEHEQAKCGPFSSTYTVISSEKNRRIVNAGTKAEMHTFASQSMQNSLVTISLEISQVKLLITDQYFLNDIYNCVLNDLLMFVPSVLGPLESSMYQFDSVNKCFVAPSLSQLIEADMDTDFFATNSINLHGDLADEHCFHECRPAALSKQDKESDSDDDSAETESCQKTKRADRPSKNLLCVCVKVDTCHLKCMVVGEKVSDGIKHGEFDVKASNFQMCITNSQSEKEGDQQQPSEKQLMSIYTDKIELGHENKVSLLKLPSNYASFDALFQTSTTRLLIGQNEPAVCQALFNSCTEAPSVSIAIKSKYKPSANKKEVTVALNFNNLCLHHVFTEASNFWIFQLIDLFNLSDIAVLGYQVPLVVTELHLNVANSSVLYEPVHLNTRAFVGFKSLHWSSNVTAESSSTLLVFNIEDIYLFLSRVVPSDKCDLKQDFVCVANTDLFELRILINDEKREVHPSSAALDIKIRSNLIQFRTCVDSAFALIELINYIVSDGDLRCEPAEPTLIGDVHESLTTPSLTSDTTVISDMVKEAMDPIAQPHDESRDQTVFDNEFQLDEPFAHRKLVFKKRDDHYQPELFDPDDDDDDEDKDLVSDFDIIEVVAGLGEPPRFNQDFEIKTLTSNNYQIREDHFKKPLTKIDVLKAPESYPCPLNVFSIQELSLNWFLYAGSDFETSPSGPSGQSSEQCVSVSPNVSYTSSSVQFSKAGGRIVKKYDNLTWLTRGGQNRNLDICMQIALHKVKTKCDIYADLSDTATATDTACLYRIALAVGDVVIRDKLSTSSFNKFLFRYESEAYPNNANSNMVFFKFLCSRSLDAQRLLECDIKVSIEPLRFAIDQDSLVFLIEFFTQLASKDLKVNSVETPNSPDPTLSHVQDSFQNKGPAQPPPPPQIYIRNFILAPDLFIKFDFSGKYDKRPDTKMDTLTKLLMVVVQLSNTEIKLKRVYYRRGFLGMDKLLHALVKEWIGDIQRNQIKNLIKGWGIFNSVIQFFEGFTYLILCPIEQYKRDGRVLFGIRKGSAAFSTCTVLATIELTNRMFQATKNVAEFFYDLVTPHRATNMIAHGHGSAIVDTLFTGVGPNRYVRIRRQPNDIREGLANAYYVLYEGFSDTAANFMSEVSHGCEHKGIPGAIGGALRQLPPTALAPIVLTAEATCNILSGIRKQLKPDEKKDDDQKWKTITFN